MKIGILTFHYCYNQGAVLQSFGLFKYLSRYGDVEFIDYRLPILKRRYSIIESIKESIRNSHNVEGVVKAVIASLFFSISRTFLFKRFICRYLKCSGCTNTGTYKHIFVGSDQVWNGKITGGYNNYYWGHFPHSNKQLIHSYAASCIASQDLSDKARVCKALSCFTNVSVRENDAHKMLEELNIANTLVLDPVFLLNKSDWEKLTFEIDEKYVYEYNILGVKASREIVDRIKKNLNIVHEKSMVYTNQKLCFSPNRFLSVIRNSQIVVTSSFHGLAFAIIFERPFVVVKSNTSKDDRLLSLLSTIGCENRAISDVSELKKLQAISWENVRKRLSVSREISKDYINECLRQNHA